MRLNQKGMSIIELLIAAGLTAIVAFGAASVIYSSQKTAQFSTAQNDVDRIHYLNIQIARNVANLQNLYNIVPSNDSASNGPFLSCLQMNPTALCSAYGATVTVNSTGITATNGSQQVSPSSIGINSIKPGYTGSAFPTLASDGTNTNLSSTIKITPHCSGSLVGIGCDYITVTVTTSYASNNISGNFVTRTSTSNLPNFLFAPRGVINNTCASNQVMYGFDYYKQVPLCGSISSTAVDGSPNEGAGYLPLLVYDSNSNITVTPTNLTSCPNGYATTGFDGSTCLPPSLGLTAPPPTMPPTTTTTSTTLVPTAGACGPSNGQGFAAAPTTGLCTTGVASSVSGSGPWTWSCIGSTTVACNAVIADNYNCSDGWTTTCGFVLVDAAVLSSNNPGEAIITTKPNINNGGNNTYCRCKTGYTRKIVNTDCSTLTQTYICQ